MNKFVIPTILIGLGLFAASKKKDKKPPTTQSGGLQTSTPSNTLNPIWVNLPTATNTAQELDGPTVYTGVNGTDVIDYKTWRRKEWANYFKQLINELGGRTAIDKVWSDWYVPENFARNIFTDKKALAFDLGTYNPNYQIASNTVITWQSSPIYASTPNAWNGGTPWDCADWKEWHQKLKAHYGRVQANQIWLNAWEDPQNQTIDNNWSAWLYALTLNSPMAQASTNWNMATFCPADCNFIEYFYSQGLDIASAFGQTGCNLENIVVETGNIVSNVFSTVSSVTGMMRWIVPVGIAVGVVVVSKNLLKK